MSALMCAVITAIPAAVAAILFQVGSIYSKRVQTRESAFTLGLVLSLVASGLSIALGMSCNSAPLILISFVGIAPFFCFAAPFMAGTRAHCKGACCEVPQERCRRKTQDIRSRRYQTMSVVGMCFEKHFRSFSGQVFCLAVSLRRAARPCRADVDTSPDHDNRQRPHHAP